MPADDGAEAGTGMHPSEPATRDPVLLARRDYGQLLARFPVHRQGYGREPTFPGIKAQPMTYALVLMAEVRRLAAAPTDEGLCRVRSAVRWLIRNSDLDGDGLPGWGLPDAWDAFGDGVGAAGDRNPADHPYTVTTALVVHALADAAALTIWRDGERHALGGLVGRAVHRWCAEVFTAEDAGGWFWYSPYAGDAHFCSNVSAMMLGATRHALVRFADAGHAWTADARIRDRVDQAARGIAEHVRWHDDTPFWNYIEGWPRPRPNDAVHHAYVLWGMELYRMTGGAVAPPWRLDQALASFGAFVTDAGPVDLPVYGHAERGGRAHVPMRLWGAGMIQAVLARHGTATEAGAWASLCRQAFGSPDQLSLLPIAAGGERTFYQRHSAHMLFGLSELAFPSGSAGVEVGGSPGRDPTGSPGTGPTRSPGTGPGVRLPRAPSAHGRLLPGGS